MLSTPSGRVVSLFNNANGGAGTDAEGGLVDTDADSGVQTVFWGEAAGPPPPPGPYHLCEYRP